MNLIKLLLVLILILNPLGCATNQHTVKEEQPTMMQKKDGDSFWGIMKFIGALCIVGITAPPEPEDEYRVREIKDGIPVEPPKYEIEKRKK